MFIGLNTFESIVIVLLFLVVVALAAIVLRINRSMKEEEGFTAGLKRHMTNEINRSSADIKEVIKVNAKGVSSQLSQHGDVLAGMTAYLKLGLPTDGIEILKLDDEIKQALIKSEALNNTIASVVLWLARRGSGAGQEVPGVGEKEIKKIEKALEEYREDHVFAEA